MRSIRFSIFDDATEPTQQQAALNVIARAAVLLQAAERDLWLEALAAAPEGLSRESRIAMRSLVNAHLARRSVTSALDWLLPRLEIPDEEITWLAFGFSDSDAPTQPVAEARALTVQALLIYALEVLQTTIIDTKNLIQIVGIDVGG